MKLADAHGSDTKSLSLLPPQNLELEIAVLGAILIDTSAIAIVADKLVPEDFYSHQNSILYRNMLSLYAKSLPIDLVTVTEELKSNEQLEEIGGAYSLVEITNKVASCANLETHAIFLKEKSTERQIIQLGHSMAKLGFDPTIPVSEKINTIEKEFSKLNSTSGSDFLSASELMLKVRNQVEAASKKEGNLTGITTGFFELDSLTYGWQPTDLIIIAARPGMGKTSFALRSLQSAAIAGHTSAFFSLEMSEVQLGTRLVSMEGEIDSSNLRIGRLDDSEWTMFNATVNKLGDIPIFIDDTPGITLYEFRSKARRLVQKHGVKIIFLDYLQLMSGDRTKGQSREQDISQISRGLKMVAKELNIPIVALSQLSRAVESRGGMKRPQLSDLRESGAIEQDADIVSFIYRPEYYGFTENEEGHSLKGIAEVIISKHRGGALDTAILRWVPEFTKFKDKETTYEQVLGGSGAFF